MTDTNEEKGTTGATGSNPSDLDVGLHFEGAAPKAAPSVAPMIGIPQDFMANTAPTVPTSATAVPDMTPPGVATPNPAPVPTTAINPAPAPTQTPAPAVPPVPAIEPTKNTPSATGGINTDIEKILRQVKLPERRDFKGGADPTQETPEKNPAVTIKPPTEAEKAVADREAHGQSAVISSVHTLKDDLQNVVKEKKISLVRAVALEQDKKKTDEDVQAEFGRADRRKRVMGILFATFLLFGLGVAALFGVYFVMLGHSATESQQLNSLVFAEQSVALPLENATGSDLKRRIAATRQTQNGSLGSITRIVPLEPGTTPNAQPRLATTAEFLNAINSGAPEDVLRSVGPEFFFGLHTVDKNAPVLVIPVTNYDRAFAGMLAWENTMNADLSPAFTPVPATILDSNGIPSQRVFADDVMRNYDVREIKDDSGQIQLYYSFPSPNLLIIAESTYSFPELLSRLQSVRRL